MSLPTVAGLTYTTVSSAGLEGKTQLGVSPVLLGPAEAPLGVMAKAQDHWWKQQVHLQASACIPASVPWTTASQRVKARLQGQGTYCLLGGATQSLSEGLGSGRVNAGGQPCIPPAAGEEGLGGARRRRRSGRERTWLSLAPALGVGRVACPGQSTSQQESRNLAQTICPTPLSCSVSLGGPLDPTKKNRHFTKYLKQRKPDIQTGRSGDGKAQKPTSGAQDEPRGEWRAPLQGERSQCRPGLVYARTTTGEWGEGKGPRLLPPPACPPVLPLPGQTHPEAG